jgi:hypothetical protein
MEHEANLKIDLQRYKREDIYPERHIPFSFNTVRAEVNSH